MSAPERTDIRLGRLRELLTQLERGSRKGDFRCRGYYLYRDVTPSSTLLLPVSEVPHTPRYGCEICRVEGGSSPPQDVNVNAVSGIGLTGGKLVNELLSPRGDKGFVGLQGSK